MSRVPKGHQFDLGHTSIPLSVVGKRPPGARELLVKCRRCDCTVSFPIYSGEPVRFTGPQDCPGRAR